MQYLCFCKSPQQHIWRSHPLISLGGGVVTFFAVRPKLTIRNLSSPKWDWRWTSSREGWRWTSCSKSWCRNDLNLTSIHNFSAIILWKYYFAKEVPPFHPTNAIPLVINMLDNVELWWNYGWNYMKFHPNSTRNSTTFKHLIIRAITTPRWKGGITNDKKYFSGKE